MKKWISLVVAGSCCLGFGQIKMQVTFQGKPAGTASMNQKLRPDGSKQVTLALSTSQGSTKVEFRSESIYAASGAPIRKFQEMSSTTQKYRRTRIATFDSKGVTLVEDINGKRSSKQYPLEASQNRDDLSEFWFLRDKPKVGQKSKCFTFNMENLSWELVETTYEGQVEVTVGGKKYKAFKTSSEKGSAYLDATGLPIRLEASGGLMDRVAE